MNKGQKNLAVCDVVVVNYNSGAYLARCVASIFRSDVPVSLTIVDNASVDDSLSKIKHLDPGVHQLHLIENSDNLGFSQGVNQGAKNGQAPVVFLLNPDCEIHPHTIKNLLAEAQAIDDFGIMGALVFNEDGTEQRGCRRLEPTFARSVVTALHLGKYFQSVNLYHDDLPEAPICIDAVSGSAMLIDRATFEGVQGMDEGYFLHVEDLDLCRRVREFGKKVYFTPNVSLFHHHGASSHVVPVRTEWFKHQGMLRYQEKFQKPNQNFLRSSLTRAVIYANFGLSILRKKMSAASQSQAPIQSLTTLKLCTFITGANSDLGEALLRKLKQKENVLAVSRKPQKKTLIGNEIWMNWSYFEKAPAADFIGIKTWLALSPVWAAPNMAQSLAKFGKIKRVIALSSTSIEGKAASENAAEQSTVSALIQGELGLINWAHKHNSQLTICRASMIYGGKHNKNIALIKRWLTFLPLFPMVSKGEGMRQPVHVDDLAQALQQLGKAAKLPQETYVLAGGERLNYRAMIERIYTTLGKKPRFISIPSKCLLPLIKIVSFIPGLAAVNTSMLARIEKDLIYDISAAEQDFNYAPSKFRP